MLVAASPPKTLTKPEQSRLLRTVARDGNPRDLALLSLVLGTPARARGLNVGYSGAEHCEVGRWLRLRFLAADSRNLSGLPLRKELSGFCRVDPQAHSRQPPPARFDSSRDTAAWT